MPELSGNQLTRRELITGFAAAAAYGRLQAQSLSGNARFTANARTGGGPPIPTGPSARWIFSTVGLADQAAITTVADQSGNGNTLTPYTSQTPQTPMYTTQAINGRGGLWCGQNPPSPGMVQSPTCTVKGAMVSPSFLNTTESAVSILFCGQFGTSTLGGSLFQIGPIACYHRDNNSQFPKLFYWRNGASGHGSLGTVTNQIPCGPVCGGVINGFGAASQSRFMLGKHRETSASLNWSAGTAVTGTCLVGWTDFGGNNGVTGNTAGNIWYEIVVYQRTLTDAELDAWQSYCNQQYGTPLALNATPNSNQKKNLLFIGDSVCNGQNAVLGKNMQNLVLSKLGRSFWDRVQTLNYGVGSSTLADHITNYAADLAPLYDSSLGAGNNWAFIQGYWNEFNNFSAAATYNSIMQLAGLLQATGFKVIVGTGLSGTGTTPSTCCGTDPIVWLNDLNGRILANAGNAGVTADATVNTTATNSVDPTFEAWCRANINAHHNTTANDKWATVLAPQIAAIL